MSVICNVAINNENNTVMAMHGDCWRRRNIFRSLAMPAAACRTGEGVAGTRLA